LKSGPVAEKGWKKRRFGPRKNMEVQTTTTQKTPEGGRDPPKERESRRRLNQGEMQNEKEY